MKTNALMIKNDILVNKLFMIKIDKQCLSFIKHINFDNKNQIVYEQKR